MGIRPFRAEDAAALAALSAGCARGESDFVLNPYWETDDELFAEFDRFGIRPEDHLLVADAGDGEVLGLVGFLRQPEASTAGMFCPIVNRGERGRGLGGELLRAAQSLGSEKLGIKLVSAAIGTRNRAMEAARSMMIEPGFIASTASCVMSVGAARPGMSAVVITTSDVPMWGTSRSAWRRAFSCMSALA